jgi:predicted amidohydrolase
MFLAAHSQCLALILVGGLVVASSPAESAEKSWDEGNIIAHGRFESSGTGELPDGWIVVAPNTALGPQFALQRDSSGGTRLSASGNGRDECFGFIKHAVHLKGGKTYRLRVRLKVHGIEDLNRHLVHGIFGHGFNEGVFEYRREGEWIIGDRSFAGPLEDVDGDVRLCFRYSAHGSVEWDRVSMQEREPIPARPVTVAVSWGWGGNDPSSNHDHWSKFLDAAGERKADVALLPEVCNVCRDQAAAPVAPETLDGPTCAFMSAKAKQWKMYVSGTFTRRDGDVLYNSAPLFDRDGKLVGVYNKNMLFDPELDNGTSPGVGYPVFDTDFGRVGIIICYDSWFPEPARLLGYKGAELVLFPNAGYYRELMPARASDNGLAIAVSSLNCPAGVWDSGGNQAGESKPEETRYAPQGAITSYEKLDDLRMVLATIDLSKKPSPHYWGGPMLSAPGPRRVRQTWRVPLESEIEREARRWLATEPAGRP